MGVLIQLDQSKLWDSINLSKPINICILTYEKQICNIQNTYPTIAEASRCTGIGSTSIGNALRGWSNSAGGYVWKFV